MVKYTNTKAKRSKECRQKKINFVHGQGKRKHQLQRDYEQLKDWKSKLKTYQKHRYVFENAKMVFLSIVSTRGNRNRSPLGLRTAGKR